MNEITFGKDRYHLNNQMEAWCKECIGDGGWGYDTSNKIWIMHTMFGNTTFAFKEAKHLTMFMLRWS